MLSSPRNVADRMTLIFSILLTVIGLSFGVALSIHVATKWHYTRILHLGSGLLTTLLLMIGSLLTLPCIYLAHVVNYRRRNRIVLATLVGVHSATLLMVCLGLGALNQQSRMLREPDVLRTRMRSSLLWAAALIPNYEDAFNAMQIDLMCCGVDSPSDWNYPFTHESKRTNSTLPPSCCYDAKNNTITKPCLEAIASTGCLQPAVADLRCYINTAAQVVAAMILCLVGALIATSFSIILDVFNSDVQSYKKPDTIKDVYQITNLY